MVFEVEGNAGQTHTVATPILAGETPENGRAHCKEL